MALVTSSLLTHMLEEESDAAARALLGPDPAADSLELAAFAHRALLALERLLGPEVRSQVLPGVALDVLENESRHMEPTGVALALLAADLDPAVVELYRGELTADTSLALLGLAAAFADAIRDVTSTSLELVTHELLQD